MSQNKLEKDLKYAIMLWGWSTEEENPGSIWEYKNGAKEVFIKNIEHLAKKPDVQLSEEDFSTLCKIALYKSKESKEDCEVWESDYYLGEEKERMRLMEVPTWLKQMVKQQQPQ